MTDRWMTVLRKCVGVHFLVPSVEVLYMTPPILLRNLCDEGFEYERSPIQEY